LVLSLVNAISPIKLDDFQRFVSKYNKQYSPEEYLIRKQIFLENVKSILVHNGQDSTFKLGVNEFADMTHEEFVSARLSKSVEINIDAAADTISLPEVAPPASLDWRTHTDPIIVGPVRNLGQCGGDATVAILDSLSADYSVLYNQEFYSFNTSYVDDCDGQKGCTGQSPSTIWNFLLKYGVWWYYDDECPSGPGVGICIANVTTIKAGNEDDLVSVVASKGPVTVLIDASQPSFQMYKSGVYYDAKCSASTLDHAVQIVGYGSTGGQDYWIARNSWGTAWGENGDILLARNKNNNCGVASSVSYANTVKNCVC